MKQFSTISLIFLLISVQSFAQVYIDTGHPSLDQRKHKNQNAEVIERTVPVVEEAVPETIEETEIETVEPLQNEQEILEQILEENEAITKPLQDEADSLIESEPIKVVEKEPVAPRSSSRPLNIEISTDAADQYPEFAEPGKCYARCYVPDEYKFVEERVVDKPVSYQPQEIPAVYITVYDTIVVQPERKYMEQIPTVYETTTERILIKPATKDWVTEKATENCLDPENDCQVVKLVEIPAEYKTLTRKVLKTPAFEREITVPAEYKIRSRKELKSPSKVVQIEIPPTYRIEMKKVLVRKGGFQEWKEVLCKNELSRELLKEMQENLKALGYDPGFPDGVMGSKTKDAIRTFQADNNLPQCNLNMETLRKLDVVK